MVVVVAVAPAAAAVCGSHVLLLNEAQSRRLPRRHGCPPGEGDGDDVEFPWQVVRHVAEGGQEDGPALYPGVGLGLAGCHAGVS